MDEGSSGDQVEKLKVVQDEPQTPKKEYFEDSGIRRRFVSSSSEQDHYEVVNSTNVTEDGSTGANRGITPREYGSASKRILQNDTGRRREPAYLMKSGGSLFRAFPRRSTSSQDMDKKLEHQPQKGTSILIKKAWTTADVLKDDSAYIIFAMRDFVVYIVFLVLLLLVTFGNIDYAYNYYANLVSDLITKSHFETNIGGIPQRKTLANLRSPNQIWDFIDGVFLKVLYSDPSSNRILLENILVGSPAIRQVRVKNGTCETVYMFDDLYKTCYDYYSEEKEDKTSFGSRSWEYENHTDVSPFRGLVGVYPHGGFEMNFTTDLNFTKAWLRELKEHTWIQQGTRLVVIDFALYSPNTNNFLVTKIVFEMLPLGGVVTSYSFIASKFIRYLTPWNCFIMSCEFMFVIFTVYFTLEEFQQIWLLREDYLTNWWNVLDVTVILLSYTVIAYGIKRLVVGFDELGHNLIIINKSEHGIFDTIMSVEENFTSSCAILCFFAWLKLFKFSTLNKSVLLILSALGNVAYELLVVTCMTLIAAVGFSLLGFCLFGGHVAEFNGMSNSFFTMISLFVGRLHFFEECDYVYSTLPRLFFTAYILLVIVIFLNTYVALIVYGYHNAHMAMHEDPDQQFLGDLLYSFVLEVLSFFWRYTMMRRLLARDLLAQRRRDFDAFVVIFKRHGWPAADLRLLLRAHQLRRGDEMTLDKMTEVYDDFCLRNQLYIEVEGHNIILAELEKIEKSLDFFDQTVLDINSKADLLVDKMMNGAKSSTYPKKRTA